MTRTAPRLFYFTCVDPACAAGFSGALAVGSTTRCPVCKIPVRLLDAEGHYDAAGSPDAPKSSPEPVLPKVREVPFGTRVEGKRSGAFVAVTAWAPIYADYDDPAMSAEYRTALFPMVLMIHRWDGKVGFVGGFVDDGNTAEEQARKEGLEEIGVRLDDRLTPLVSHETAGMTTHLYRYDLRGITPTVAMRVIVGVAAQAELVVAEGHAFWAHLADYGRNRGWRTLRDASNLSDAVGEELDAVRAWMYANAPEGAHR